jgi:hypothetical protein
MFWPNCNCSTVCEHGVKGYADGRGAQQARSTRADADDVVYIRPAKLDFFNVAGSKTFIEDRFHTIRTAVQRCGLGCGFGSSHRLIFAH